MLSLLFALITAASATTWHSANETIWDVHAKKYISLDELQAATGAIFVLGEDHAVPGSDNDAATYIHHHNQLRLIEHFKAPAHTVSVGMEFLTYTFQNFVDQFVAGVLPEADFLKQVQWSGNPFQFYRPQILASTGRTVALNIPGDVAGQVAKGGKDSLSPGQKALTPPLWERGNDKYFERFSETMKGHAPPEAIENYFWAQSLWDDTMAWKAAEHRTAMPNDVMVVVIGEFHVEFGGGMPSELKKMTNADVKTVLQIETPDWQPATLQDAVTPDPDYGDAADYLWLHHGIVQD